MEAWFNLHEIRVHLCPFVVKIVSASSGLKVDLPNLIARGLDLGKIVCIRRSARRSKARISDAPMADREDKNPENVAGQFYVDSQCIDCDLCRETAPKNFVREEDEGYSYVFAQPTNDEEREQCVEAMEGCPVEAIGEDGKDDKGGGE